MANDFKNTTLVTRYAVKEFLNALMMAGKVDRQLDEKNVFNKVGATVNVRRPVYFAATDGAVIEAGETSDIEEGIVPVVLDTRKKVVFTISSQDQTLKIEDANTRYIRPAMQELAQKVESAIAASYTNIFNFVGAPGTTPGNFLSVANAGAKLDLLGVPDDGLKSAFYGPSECVNLADGLKAVFPQKIATKAIENATIGAYAGFNIYKNQSLKLHTVGVNTGTPLVKGASQETTYALSKDTGTQSFITDGWTVSQTGILKAGDIFTIAGVYAVNRRTRESTGELAQFVVTADADSPATTTGATTFTIAPPIITSGAFQTVDASPADNAAITVKTGTGGTQYRQNLAFHKNAITLATAQLDLPDAGVTAYRQNFDNVSMRLIKQYNITNDETVMRFDILFGVKVQNPEFAVRTTS